MPPVTRTSRHRTRLRRLLGVGTAFLAMGLGVGAPATAAVPTPGWPTAAEFRADQCPGTTLMDPTATVADPAVGDSDVVPDLTRVWGARLSAYNAGRSVVLYDAYGVNNTNGYPATCMVRHVPGQGAVSEWAFCTDLNQHTCAGTDAQGNTLAKDGTPIAPLVDLPEHTVLTDDQQVLVEYLVRNGTSFTHQGTTYVSQADGTSDQRVLLQHQVWCITNGDAATDAIAGNLFALPAPQPTCQEMLPTAQRTAILATHSLVPRPLLSLAGPAGSTVQVAEPYSVELTTDQFSRPIAWTLAGAADLSSTDPAVTLSPTSLTVAGSGTTARTVRLVITPRSAGPVTLEATVATDPAEGLDWSQSPTAAAACQIYAHAVVRTYSASGRVAFRAVAPSPSPGTSTPTPTTPTSTTPTTTVPGSPTPSRTPSSTDEPTPLPSEGPSTGSTPEGPETDLPDTGASTTTPVMAVAVMALLSGVALLRFAPRRVRRAARHAMRRPRH